MRILLAHSFYRIAGGEDSHVRRQQELLGRSHEVELFEKQNTSLDETPSTAARMAYSRRNKKEAEEVIDRFRPDVVHVHNTYPALGPAVHLAARTRGVPLVMTVHNYRLRCPNSFMFTEGDLCRRCVGGKYWNGVVHECFVSKKQALAYSSILWVHRFVMRIERHVALFIVPSEFLQKRLLGWGIDADRIRVVRHFTESRGRRRDGTGSYGIFVGRLSAEKGLDVLLQALQIAGDPPFIVVGDGPLRSALERAARAWGLEHTRFLGHRPHDEIPELLAGARYLAAPSRGEETGGLSGLEAIAAGVPLLISDRGALPELIEEGAGFVSPADDADSLAAGIRHLHADDDLCRRLGRVASQRAREVFSPQRHLAALEQTYAVATTGS